MHLPQFARTERRGQPAVLQGADPNDTMLTVANGTPRASASAVRVRMSFSRISRIIAKLVLYSKGAATSSAVEKGRAVDERHGAVR